MISQMLDLSTKGGEEWTWLRNEDGRTHIYLYCVEWFCFQHLLDYFFKKKPQVLLPSHAPLNLEAWYCSIYHCFLVYLFYIKKISGFWSIILSLISVWVYLFFSKQGRHIYVLFKSIPVRKLSLATTSIAIKILSNAICTFDLQVSENSSVAILTCFQRLITSLTLKCEIIISYLIK